MPDKGAIGPHTLQPRRIRRQTLTRYREPSPAVDLVLALRFDRFQHPELLLRDIRERDGQPDVLSVQNAEAPPNKSAVRRVHRLFEQVLGAVRPVTDIDGLPICAAGGAAIQSRSARSVRIGGSGRRGQGAVFYGGELVLGGGWIE